MIKCGVCGSENEAGAKFCGVCGSSLDQAVTPGATKPAEPVQPVVPTPPTPPDADDTVVPGRGDGRRELGIGDAPTTVTSTGAAATTPVVAEPEPTGPTIVCAVCGTVNDASRTYCRKCANELRPAAAPPPPPATAPAGRRLSPILVGLVAAGVVVALGVGLIMFLNGPGPSASPSAGATRTPGAPTGSPGTASDAPSAPPSAPAFEEGDTPPGVILWAGGNRAGGQGTRQIFAAPADGSGEPDQLTDQASFARDPGAAPDGGRIAYSSSLGLRLLDLEADEDTSLTQFGADINPSWSPISDEIVFTAKRNNEADNEIRLKVAGETQSRTLTNNDVEDHDPIFTPDGRSVIWVQGEGNDRELMMIDLETNQITPLTDDDFNDVDPAVSKDGILAFASNRGGDGFDLWSIDLASPSADAQPLGAPTEDDEHDPWFSPGGRYVVFSAGPFEEEDLFILDRGDADTVEPFIEDPESRELSPIWVPEIP